MNRFLGRVARAIQEECSGSAWPDGGTPEQTAERQHWYACAGRAMDVVVAELLDGTAYLEWYRHNADRLDEIDPDMTHATTVAHYLRYQP